MLVLKYTPTNNFDSETLEVTDESLISSAEIASEDDIESTLGSDNVRVSLWDKDEYDAMQEKMALEWESNRKREYNALNQFEMMYDDKVNSTNTWVEKIQAIKTKYPKPAE